MIVSKGLKVNVNKLSLEISSGEKNFLALKNLSFNINPGETLGIVGQSGAGKSVLIKTLVNFIPKTGKVINGNVQIGEMDVFSLSNKHLRLMRGSKVGVIVQNARKHLHPLITIGNQISNVYLAHFPVKKKVAWEKTIEMLQLVGMPAPEERMLAYPHELSGGMVQRVVIAMSLICKPNVVLADEPTSGLDVTIQEQILQMLNKLVRERNASVLLVTRDMGIVANFCDRIAVLENGEFIEHSSVDEFFLQSTNPVTKALIQAASISDKFGINLP